MAIGQVFRELCAQRLSALYDPCMIWWTQGSECVEPTCLIGKGLPAPSSFAALLDGVWYGQPWQPVPAVAEEPVPTAEDRRSTCRRRPSARPRSRTWAVCAR